MGDETLVHNYLTERRLAAGLPAHILLGDETLRGEEPTPGAVFSSGDRGFGSRCL